MALQTFFSLTPKSPRVNSYNSANPTAPYVNAYLYSYGGITFSSGYWTLAGQYNNDEIIVGYDPVGLNEQTISNTINDIYRRCVIRIYFYGKNVSTENDYMLLFALRGIGGNPNAQFFIGSDLVRTEPLTADEQVPILIPCPGDGIGIKVYIRLASDSYYARMGFKGVDCYLL